MMVAVSDTRVGSIVSAQVAVNAARKLRPGFGPRPNQGKVRLHELVQALGLGHLDDPTQLLNLRATERHPTFGLGARA